MNRAPNSGPLTQADFSESVERVLRADATVTLRTVRKEELGGYALTDALRFDIPEMFYSFSGLALSIVAGAESVLSLRPDGLRVLELGCGSGALGCLLMRLNVSNYIGIDGNALAGRFSPHMRFHRNRFLFLNLQEPIKLYADTERVYFDIVCSFEVLEHIAESTVDIFLQNITFHLRTGGLFICSISMQDRGDVHVTVRPRGWWLERFATYGLMEFDGRHLEENISREHPCNWTPERSNVFILENKK